MAEPEGVSPWNIAVIDDFNAGKEMIADTFPREALLLLDTIGAKSGKLRRSPVAYFQDGDHLLVVASKAGADDNPAWYHNLRANPQVTIQRWEDDRLVREERTATVLSRDERDAVWPQITAAMPGFADYQTKTDRVIPVVRLDRVRPGSIEG